MACYKKVYSSKTLNERDYYKALSKLKSNAMIIHTIDLANGHDLVFMSTKPRYITTDPFGLPIYKDDYATLNSYTSKNVVEANDNLVVSRFGLPNFIHLFEDQPYCDYETFVDCYDFNNSANIDINSNLGSAITTNQNGDIELTDIDILNSVINNEIPLSDIGLEVKNINQRIDPLDYFGDLVVVDGIINLNIVGIEVTQVV